MNQLRPLSKIVLAIMTRTMKFSAVKYTHRTKRNHLLTNVHEDSNEEIESDLADEHADIDIMALHLQYWKHDMKIMYQLNPGKY